MKLNVKSTFFLALLLALMISTQAFCITPKKLKIGFIPGETPHELVTMWAFVLRHLTAKTGIPCEMVVKDNYRGVVDAFIKGEIDLIEGGAYAQGLILQTGNAIPLVGEEKYGNLTYKSFVVVRADSDIKTLNDLKEKKFVFTNLLSTSGYIVPRLLFEEKGIKDLNSFFGEIVLSGTHKNSLDMLLKGNVDGIAIGDFFVYFEKPAVKEKLRIIESSAAIPVGPFSANKRLDKDLLEKLKQALLTLHENVPAGSLEVAYNDSFVEYNPEFTDKLIALTERGEKLKPILFTPAPTKYAFALSSEAKKISKRSILYLVLTSTLFLLLLTVIIFYKRNKLATKQIALFVYLPVVFLLIIIFAFETVSVETTLSSRTEKSIRRIDELFANYVESLKQDGAQTLTPIALNKLIKEDESIVGIRVFHEGIYVADTTGTSLGASIVDAVFSKSISIPHPKDGKFKEVYCNIYVDHEVWGVAQILLSYIPLNKLIKDTLMIHFLILGLLSLLAGILFYAVKNYFIKPLGTLAQAVDSMRRIQAGKQAEEGLKIKSGDNLEKLAETVSAMGSDVAEKSAFLEIKSEELASHKYDLQDTQSPMSPELFKKLNLMIRELEQRHPNFKRLRETELIGKSSSFLRAMMDAIIRSKDSDPVVIYGLTGSGKTGIAKAVHQLSERAERKFGEFNCAELASADPTIVLGKLFGYGKNSGIQGIPKEGQSGLLEHHNGGTIFLDEVEILPPHAQQLLLLPLEGRPFNPASGIGDPKIIDVRFIFASNLPLEEEVNKGNLRADLCRRIGIRGTITIPPLKARSEDIEILAQHFLNSWNKHTGLQMIFSKEMMDHLQKLDYLDYNVSELKTVVTMAADMARFTESSTLTIEHLKRTTACETIKKSSDGKSDYIFDEEELKELEVLRKNSFKVGPAEEELGYSKGAKTLSNHFRGICYKTLCSCIKQSKNEEHLVELAGNLIIGNAISDDINGKIINKVQRSLDRLKNSTEDDFPLLFNNLPNKYHDILTNLRGILSKK